jgi:hypothetical protein
VSDRGSTADWLSDAVDVAKAVDEVELGPAAPQAEGSGRHRIPVRNKSGGGVSACSSQQGRGRGFSYY